MMIGDAKVKVNNVDERCRRYIVAKLVNGQLWFWGSWDDLKEAENIADGFDNGIVVEAEEYDD